MDIKVGSLVKVDANKPFPCDLLLLNSDLPKGICYVETKNIDGETNLKFKQADKNFVKMSGTEQDILTRFNNSEIDCKPPNEFLYEFDGNILMTDNTNLPLNVDGFLLKGSVLRNTGYVYGVAVYTGHDTKIMNNNQKGKQKKSDIEKKTD